MREYETISIEKKGEVDWLTLNRPEALNSISTPMVTELRDYFGGLMEDRFTRIVVMKGAGRAFCAGLDIKAAKAGTACFTWHVIRDQAIEQGMRTLKQDGILKIMQGYTTLQKVCAVCAQ